MATNAVDLVLPQSHHGLCLWHLSKNAAKHLSKVLNSFQSFAPQFKACIYDPDTVEDFEHSWDNLLEDFGLRDNEWLKTLYELRYKWTQVYSHTHFCASITTTQRSESINHFLKAYFSHGNIVLREFVDQYSKAMADRREKEREAENRTEQTSTNFISGWSVEHEAARKYTHKMFYDFQKELQCTIDLSLELEEDGAIQVYRAREMEGRKRIRKLSYNHSEQSVACTCRKFEFNGIICSHSLKLFRHLEYKSLPPQYYMKRWTRTIIDEDVCDPHGDLIPNDNDPLLTAHYSELSHISQRIVAKGSKSKEVFSLTKSLIVEVEEKVDAYILSKVAEQRATIQNPVTTLDKEFTKSIEETLSRGIIKENKRSIGKEENAKE